MRHANAKLERQLCGPNLTNSPAVADRPLSAPRRHPADGCAEATFPFEGDPPTGSPSRLAGKRTCGVLAVGRLTHSGRGEP